MKKSFNKKQHKYMIDGKPATGITTIIGVLAKPALINWSARMAADYVSDNVSYVIAGEDGGFWAVKPSIVEESKTAHTRKKEEAGAHGTSAHELVEDYINRCIALDSKPESPKNMPEEMLQIKKFIDWAIENVDHFLFSERQMYNKELFIAGTADFGYIGKDGRKYIGDFKTSSGIYGADYWLQVAGYRFLAEAEGDEPYDGATIVRLGKDGAFEVQQLFEYETFKQGFLACLKLYRLQASINGLVVKPT